ncbi:TetR/AcrR family transcriptional regulator [Streptomyces aidingensis]|uniref:DNA-binding transcriptional regulator, AcrR family n=1 Tax=Streptomyces aidingensis TaxID=910347 RepID=A0A1I1H7F1_9ACTN|nr:TetR/AcrR family transcriptional regulator [Streptomyces aidingensis]SFC17988.1 DNA-binding transcriptional regulator, AcrR family [Streptomyces aidingensis]
MTRQEQATTAGTTAGTATAGPRLRADAVRNRERIVEAAREVLGEQGAEAALDEIARRAGVGNATLYRHFPSREALVSAVMCTVTERITERARAALEAEHDAFHILGRILLATIDERLGAMCTLLPSGWGREDRSLMEASARLQSVVEKLVGRAQRAGQLRDDIGTGDLLIAIGRLTRPLPGPSSCSWGEEQTRRHLLIFLDGLRAPGRSVLPGRPTALDDLWDRP